MVTNRNLHGAQFPGWFNLQSGHLPKKGLYLEIGKSGESGPERHPRNTHNTRCGAAYEHHPAWESDGMDRKAPQPFSRPEL